MSTGTASKSAVKLLTVAQIRQQQEALVTQLAEAAQREIGDYAEAVQGINDSFAELSERATTIKAAYPQYQAPWTIQAMRKDMKIKEWLNEQGNNPATASEISEGTGFDLATVSRLLKTGSESQRKLFVKIGEDKWKAKA